MDNKMTMKMLTERLGACQYADIALTGTLEGVTLRVRRTLPLNDAMRFISDVVSSCADVDEGEYTYSGYDFALRANTVSYYAELKMNKSDMAKLYRLMYETDIYGQVIRFIDCAQYNALEEAAQRELAYRRDMLTSTAGSKVMEMLAQMNEFAQAADEMTEQMRSIDIEGAMNAAMNMVSPSNPQGDSDHKVLVMKKKRETPDGIA